MRSTADVTTAQPTQPQSAPRQMPPEQSAALAEFARACKAAARAVSLYPGSHPAIGVSLTRLLTAAGRLAGGTDLVLVVHPTTLLIDDRAPIRPDAAIAELADLLHGRLIGTLRVQPSAPADAWREFLLLLARPVEELIAEGGITRVWAATGRGQFDVLEIDYAEVLRERRGSEGAAWDRVLAFCLKGEAVELDDAVIGSLIEAVANPETFGALLDRLGDRADAEGTTISARVAALMHLLRATLAAVEARHAGASGHALTAIAQATPHLTPDMLLGLLAHRTSTQPEDAAIANAIAERMDEGTIASVVARSVVAERGASERLAQVFETLVPEAARKAPLLELARAEAEGTEFGADPRFAEIWENAATMLSYSDKTYVSADYARELSAARANAAEVERLSDDPPERIAGWLATVGEAAVRDLDLQLLVDLLHIETDPAAWNSVALMSAQETARRTLVGDVAGAQRLAGALAAGALGAQEGLHAPARGALDALAAGPFVRHVATLLRKANDTELAALRELCLTVGPRLVLPFAELLSTEEHTHTIRRIRELLIGFGAEGRRAVEPLKNAASPAVRRTAVDLLRMFGGNEALGELSPLLDDADPQVQRDAVRAIVQIGTPEAFAVLDQAMQTSAAARERIVREVIGLRDSRSIPSLAAVLRTTAPRGALASLHQAVIDALAGLGAHTESTAALREALERGDWWAPVRTATLRKAAAGALRRIGSAESLAALEDAAQRGSRGVRTAARLALERVKGQDR